MDPDDLDDGVYESLRKLKKAEVDAMDSVGTSLEAAGATLEKWIAVIH